MVANADASNETGHEPPLTRIAQGQFPSESHAET